MAANPKTSVKAGRPNGYSELLTQFIADDPISAKSHMLDWEEEHVRHPRFILKGFGWFLDNLGMSANAVSEYRTAALEEIEKLTESGAIDWWNMPGTTRDRPRYWREMSRQQFNTAAAGGPILYTKALTIIMACDLAAQAKFGKNATVGKVKAPFINKPEDIYVGLRIIPACWNIDGFNTANVEAIVEKNPSFKFDMLQLAGQDNRKDELIDDLAGGSTVTHSTAKKIFDECKRVGYDLGKNPSIRASRGRYLGTKSASFHELVDRSV